MNSRPRTRRELIIEAWNRLDQSAVGEDELRKIQETVREEFGEAAVDSPAAIARVLADEGAELRHPEVIEFDARWRETKIKTEARKFGSFEAFPAGRPLRLKHAEAFIKRLDRLRNRLERAGDKAALQRARKIAVDARQGAQSLAQDRTRDDVVRTEQAEIAEWLAVWIQTPNLFHDWFELRRRSPEFRRKFPPDRKTSHRDTETQSGHEGSDHTH